jgi:hypothetical protein
LVRSFRRDIYWLQPMLVSASRGWTGRLQNAFLEALFQFLSVSRRRRRTGRRQNAFLEYSLPNAFNGALRSTSWLVRSFRRDIYWLQPLLISASRGWTGWLQNAFLEALS